MFRLARTDLDEMLRLGAADFEALRGARIFLTGGTGFFGKWLLAAFDHAGRELNLGLQLTILSRDPRRFLSAWPEARGRTGWNFLEGDVAEVPNLLHRYEYVLHAAADTTAVNTPAEEAARTRTIVDGTQRMLEIAERGRARRMLLVSSGAIYGAAAGRREGAKESDADAARAVTPYGQAKRAAELACGKTKVDCTLARAFAFLGPHLPLEAHYAAGNFVRDALRGGPIEVRGDGTALRSYLYPTDLVVCLLAILMRGGRGEAYNVGSDEVVSTAELARAIADDVTPPARVEIQAKEPQGPQHIYLPAIAKARDEFGLRVNVPLREAIRRTLAFHRGGSPGF
jgi:nucleoside-diphosphate-sugar epimerase